MYLIELIFIIFELVFEGLFELLYLEFLIMLELKVYFE